MFYFFVSSCPRVASRHGWPANLLHYNVCVIQIPVGLPSPLDKRKNYRKEEEKGKDNQEMYVHIRIQPGEKNRKRRSNTNMFRGHGQKERCI